MGIGNATALGVAGFKLFHKKWTLLVFHALTTGVCLSFGIFNIW